MLKRLLGTALFLLTLNSQAGMTRIPEESVAEFFQTPYLIYLGKAAKSNDIAAKSAIDIDAFNQNVINFTNSKEHKDALNRGYKVSAIDLGFSINLNGKKATITMNVSYVDETKKEGETSIRLRAEVYDGEAQYLYPLLRPGFKG